MKKNVRDRPRAPVVLIVPVGRPADVLDAARP